MIGRRFRDLGFRIRALLRPGSTERELVDEVRFHLQMETEKLQRQGMAPGEAGREARRRFGGIAYHQERAREAWGITMLRDFFDDVRHALRQFRRRPGTNLLALLTLGLGLGATASLFSVVRGLLLRPLPITREAELQVFWSDWNWRGAELDFVRERMQTFSGLAAYTAEGLTYRSDAGSRLVLTGLTSANFFDVLGARPLLGRTFVAEEDRPGAEPVVVLSWSLWRQELGGDSTVIGRRVLLDGTPTTVVGVMPRGFFFPSPEYRAWRPLTLDPASPVYQGRGWLVLLGRTRPNATAGAVNGDIQAIAKGLGERFTYTREWDKTQGASVRPVREYLLGSVKPALLLLLGAVGVLLLISGVNSAALVLARTTDRSGELGLRVALGAGRGRLIRQIVTESVTLSMLAGVVGALIAIALFRGLVASLPLSNGFDQAVSLDWSTFAAGALLALMMGLLVSAIPVRHLVQGRLSGVTAEAGYRSSPGAGTGARGAGRGRGDAGGIAGNRRDAAHPLGGPALCHRSGIRCSKRPHRKPDRERRRDGWAHPVGFLSEPAGADPHPAGGSVGWVHQPPPGARRRLAGPDPDRIPPRAHRCGPSQQSASAHHTGFARNHGDDDQGRPRRRTG